MNHISTWNQYFLCSYYMFMYIQVNRCEIVGYSSYDCQFSCLSLHLASLTVDTQRHILSIQKLAINYMYVTNERWPQSAVVYDLIGDKTSKSGRAGYHLRGGSNAVTRLTRPRHDCPLRHAWRGQESCADQGASRWFEYMDTLQVVTRSNACAWHAGEGRGQHLH